jgi:Protein of unknown function (DUF3800)
LSVLHAFIDESGGRAVTAKSTDYFVLTAVVIDQRDFSIASQTLAQIRDDLGRMPADPLSWKNIKSHSQRLRAAQLLGSSPFSISTVVVCKRHLATALPSEDHAYLYTLRFLLERLSWLARDRMTTIRYTLAMITRFRLATLREYEARLRHAPTCQITWEALPFPGRIDQPTRQEFLQLADLAASATAKAFEPDRFGNTERRYLEMLVPRLYRRGVGSTALTSYGLKMHPWHEACRQAHPWVGDL